MLPIMSAATLAQTLEIPLQAIDGRPGGLARERQGGLRPSPVAVERSDGEFLLALEGSLWLLAASVMSCTLVALQTLQWRYPPRRR
jgi:hypothetical protein